MFIVILGLIFVIIHLPSSLKCYSSVDFREEICYLNLPSIDA